MDIPIGQRIRAWRLFRRKTQAFCAEAMGLQISGLSRIENGKQRVTGEQIEAFAKAVDLDMGTFYGALPTSPPAAANG